MPTPVSNTGAKAFAAVVWKASPALCAPVAAGAKRSATWQASPAANVAPAQVSLCRWNWEASAPVSVSPEIVSGAGPQFVSVTACAPLTVRVA